MDSLMTNSSTSFLELKSLFSTEDKAAKAFYKELDTLKKFLQTTTGSITPPSSPSSPGLETSKGAMDDIRQQVLNEESSDNHGPHRKT